jgi:pSer/pThr/pTyr-binding forkhead associated (FHA) protein
VRVDRVTVIGRLDSEDPAAEADLDLGPYGGAELGVSRQHAILMPNIEGLWLVDLDSTNGTWINGLYLQPGMKYRLRNGDVIDFGSLRVLVRVIGAINYTPSQEENAGSATLVSRRKPPRNGV